MSVVPKDFAFFEDGPFLQLMRRSSVLRSIVASPARRILVAVAVAWLPLLVLSIHDGLALHGVALPFFPDIQTQVRMLVTLPLYIIAAHQADRFVTPALEVFVKRGIVRDHDLERFRGILRAASRWNHLVVFRLAILVVLVFSGDVFWKNQLAARNVTAWYGEIGPSGVTLTPAGQWFMWVAYPLFQYIHLLWGLRLLMYAVMLARIAALDLHLVATHPDRAGGMGFLGNAVHGFFGLVLAEGATVAGILANRTFYEGRGLTRFELAIASETAFVAIMVLGPMCVFVPRLIQAKRRGMAEYGDVANRYVRKFEEEWVLGKADIEGRELLGSGDVQSLADMANSWQVVNEMRTVPFSNMIALWVVVLFLLPIAPLLLTVIPADQLLDRIAGGLLG